MIPLNKNTFGLGLACFILLATFPIERVFGQDTVIRYGRGVPPTVRMINNRSLNYLARTQNEDGSWPDEQNGLGVIGICIMAFMASGEDPDFGPYATHIRKGLRNIIVNQDPKTGHLSGPGHGSMYHHGFAMLALSEAYGAVDEQLLWQGIEVPADWQRTISRTLELAVRCALTAQKKNPWGAWRYSPDSQDADTTVSGTVLMGLLGARNAGIEIPNEAIDKALSFFRTNTMRDGNISYQPASSHGDGITRTAIGTLIYAIGKRKDLLEYKTALKFIKKRIDQDTDSHPFYNRYYMAQALFQSDFEAWKSWNRRTIEHLQRMQEEDGSFSSSHGRAYGTGMSVLSLALNYRLLPVYER
ncbi:squalene--hopene cyclase [Candidatus Poribacteria bacterium]|nr:squalene--hopene cyclase [Candidatus Poribacteria bacterium]